MPDDGLAAGLDGAGADEHTQRTEVLVAHPVGVGLEVAEGFVAFAGQGTGEFQVAGGGQQGGDVAGVEFAEPFGEPVRLAVAQQPGGEGGQVVDVLAGVVEVNDLGGGREQLAGEIPDLIPVPRLSRWFM